MTIPNGVVAAVAAAGKALLRLEGNGEDSVLARIAASAVLLAEAYCGTVLVAREFAEALDADGSWQRLSRVPVTAIAAGLGYAVDIDAEGCGWVRGGPGRVTVAYNAGAAGDWDAVPAPIAQGVAMLVAHLFDHREDGAAPPAAVAALWRPYRRMRLGLERHA